MELDRPGRQQVRAVTQRRVSGPAPTRPHEGMICAACVLEIFREDSFIAVYPSWERHHHYLHARCYRELMGFAAESLLRQMEFQT